VPAKDANLIKNDDDNKNKKNKKNKKSQNDDSSISNDRSSRDDDERSQDDNNSGDDVDVDDDNDDDDELDADIVIIDDLVNDDQFAAMLIRWLVNDGDRVRQSDRLAELLLVGCAHESTCAGRSKRSCGEVVCYVRSPCDGSVRVREFGEGEVIRDGDVLVRLTGCSKEAMDAARIARLNASATSLPGIADGGVAVAASSSSSSSGAAASSSSAAVAAYSSSLSSAIMGTSISSHFYNGGTGSGVGEAEREWLEAVEISIEIARLERKRGDLDTQLRRHAGCSMLYGDAIDDETIKNPVVEQFLALDHELNLRLIEKRRELLDIYRILTRHVTMRGAGTAAARMDVEPHRHLCDMVEGWAMAALKYSPTEAELATEPAMSKQIVSLEGPDEDEQDEEYEGYVFGRTISTYPWNLKDDTREGDPICDYFATRLYENRSILAVADGCNWGPAPAEAAQRSATAFVDYMARHQESVQRVDQIAHLILEAFAEAHDAIIMDKEDPFTAGTATLLGGMLVQLNKIDEFGQQAWAFVFAAVGDCKAFLFSRASRRVTDLTAGNRTNVLDARDCGGRLGPYRHKGQPDLRNLGVYSSMCHEGDLLILCSDGVHDNLDPQILGKFPSDLGLPEQNWEDADVDAIDDVKTAFRCKWLEEHIFAKTARPTPMLTVSRLTNHCTEATRLSREFMEHNPGLHLPCDYQAFPGKLDHTTALCSLVTLMPRIQDDQDSAAAAAASANASTSIRGAAKLGVTSPSPRPSKTPRGQSAPSQSGNVSPSSSRRKRRHRKK
jgi:serine/threonine protein phosphatase PrpC